LGRHLLSKAASVPVPYHLLAGFCAFLLAQLNRSTPCCGPVVFNGPADGLADLLLLFTTLFLAAAPVLALLWPVPATVVALLPAVQLVMNGGMFGFAWFAAPVAVGMVATWRWGWRGLLPAGLGYAVYVGGMMSGRLVLVAPDGSENDLGYQTPDGRLITAGLYAALVLVLVAAAMWLRTWCRRTAAEAELAARSAHVDDREAVIGERARLARDLHDVVAHHVSLIAVRAETAPYTEPELPSRARAVLSEIASDARLALDELRGVLGILSRAEGAADRTPQPTLSDVAGLLERSRSAGADVRLDGDVTVPVGAAAGYAAFRVVQEAVTNARRHAPGQPVDVAVAVDGGLLGVRVSNPLAPGVAPRAEGGPAGHGVAGMRERVEALGGALHAEAADGSFVVTATLPRDER
jgi:signal transduction histidine kinase